MSTDATRAVRTNAEVARAMLVAGFLFLGVAVVLTFVNNWLATYVNSGPAFLTSLIVHIWSILVQVGYPLGSFLIVGAIIVNRLPERPIAP